MRVVEDVMNGGYPLELFVERPVDDRLVCKLCDRVLRRAKTTPCGQFYCNVCLESWTATNAVCPRRCCNLVTQNTLAWAGHIDAVVSGLKTHCDSGCKVQVPLREKSTHELLCPQSQGQSCGDRSNSFTELDARLDAFDDEEEKESLGFFQRATKIVLSFRSAKHSRRKQAKAAAKQENKVKPMTILSLCNFNITLSIISVAGCWEHAYATDIQTEAK